MSELTNFSEWYKEKLAARGVTAGEFAQSALISRAASYFYTSGDRVPTEKVQEKIAKALGIDPDTLPQFAPKSTK